MTGPCDVSLVVLVSDRHAGVLSRCIDSVVKRGDRPLVQEIVIGYETKAPELVIEGVEVRCERIGTITDFAAAWDRLSRVATLPFLFFMHADEYLLPNASDERRAATFDLTGRDVPSGVTGHLGVQIAQVAFLLKQDINALWLPCELGVIEGNVHRRVVERRVVRWRDGWEWRDPAYPKLVKVGNDESTGERIPENRAAEATLVIRRAPVDECDVTGSLRRISLSQMDSDLVALVHDMERAGRREMALARLREAITLTEDRGVQYRLAIAALQIAIAVQGERIDFAQAEWFVNVAKKTAAEGSPYPLLYEIAIASALQKWDRVASLYFDWRAADSRYSGLRYDDRPMLRHLLTHVCATQAFYARGDVQKARLALAQIPSHIQDDNVRMLRAALAATG